MEVNFSLWRINWNILLSSEKVPISVVLLSKVWVWGRSLSRDGGFESHRRRGYLRIVSVVCYQVEVSAEGRSLIQRSPNECDASECDFETLRMGRPWLTGSCRGMNNNLKCSPLSVHLACTFNIFLFSVLYWQSVSKKHSFSLPSRFTNWEH